MKTFLKILNGFFVFLGVVFFIIILALTYLWFADPLGIKPMFIDGSGDNTITRQELEENRDVDAHPLLDSSQESLLRLAGINPATLPTEITPELQACVLGIVGEERAREIADGATPTFSEVIKGKACLNE